MLLPLQDESSLVVVLVNSQSLQADGASGYQRLMQRVQPRDDLWRQIQTSPALFSYTPVWFFFPLALFSPVGLLTSVQSICSRAESQMTGKAAGVAVRERFCPAGGVRWGMRSGVEAKEIVAAVERFKLMAWYGET